MLVFQRRLDRLDKRDSFLEMLQIIAQLLTKSQELFKEALNKIKIETHQKSSVLQNPTFPCTSCNKNFSGQLNLNIHMKSVHSVKHPS